MTGNTDGKSMLREAYWIWPGKITTGRTFDLYNTYAHFIKGFDLDSTIDEAMFYVTADQSYRLWINGKYITRGPARGYQSHWPYDEIDVAPWLKAGKNYICVEVYNPGISTFSYISQSSAGFLCAGNFGIVKVRSDSSWVGRFDPAHKKNTAHYSLQMGLQEHVDARKDDRSWITSPELYQSWEHVQITAFGAMPWHDVEERGIPQLREARRFPDKVISCATGKMLDGYEDWRNIAEGLAIELDRAEWSFESSCEKLSDNQHITIPPVNKETFRAVVLDMGETVVGSASLTVDGGQSGAIIDMFFSEFIDERMAPIILSPESENCWVSMTNRLILNDGNTSYQFFQLLGFRYITLVVRDNSAPLYIKISITDTGYPYTLQGCFDSSDQLLNNIWKICRRTQQVCSLDAYVDTPWREQAQWWGDARIQFWNTMAIDGDVRLFKRGIRSIAGQRVPNGLTYGHAPTIAHTCILPDFSLVWIITIYDYYWQTGDLSLFKEQISRVWDVLSYFKKEAPVYNGLLSYDSRYWLFLDWSDIMKEGVPALYNMWYLMALRVLAQLLKLSGYDREFVEIEHQSQELQKSIEDHLFDNKTRLFCDGLDENGIPVGIHSVHCQTFAIMLGLKPECHDNMLHARILPFLRGEKMNVPVPSAYWTSYVLIVAREKGYFKEALEFIRGMWSPMVPISTTTEIFDTLKGNFSASHAWSAHPVFHLMNLLGGVVQAAVDWNKISYKPYFAPELDHVYIAVPSPYGLIESRWERKGNGIDVSLSMPKGIVACIGIPGYEGEISGSFVCQIQLGELKEDSYV